MSWLKRQQPLSLVQSSDLPFVILENGVRLCHSNFYEEDELQSNGEYRIHLSVPRSAVIRQSTYLFKFKEFPITVPFSNIYSLDNTILDGKILRHAGTQETEDKRISAIKMERLPELFNEYSSQLDGYDHNFILSNGEDIVSEARLLEMDGQAHVLYHKEWGRTCVAMAHQTCNLPVRKYCWTKHLSDLDVTCFGLDSADDKESIHSCLEDIGISASVMWVD